MMRFTQNRTVVVITIISACLFLTARGLSGGFSHTRLLQPGSKSAESLRTTGALSPSSPTADDSARLRASEAYGKLPLSFEVNQGQADARVRFLSRGDGYNLFLTANEAVLSLSPSRAAGDAPPSGNTAKGLKRATNDTLRMKLVGANPAPKIEGTDQLPGNSNYFVGKNPRNWRVNVSTFARVHYREVYPGVDVVYYGNQRQLENDFIVAPGVDPGVIELAFAGAHNISINEEGSLVLSLARGDVRLQKPVIYQEADGVRHEIAGKYVSKNLGNVGFELAAYDHTRPLVIDPILVYSFPLAGNGSDSGNAIAVDASGNAYITGETTSTVFPTAAALDSTLGGGRDAFVAKINAAGTALIYSTYIGGSNIEFGFDIAIDGAGNAYITGRTSSNDFPVMNAFDATYSGGSNEDAFLTRLNPAGSALVYSTYLSGQFGARGFGIATDGAGNAYVTGTTSTGFPVTAATAFDSTQFNTGFLSKLNTNGSGASSLVYSTYLGHAGFGEGRAVAADTAGNVYVTGNLNSTATNFASSGAFQTTYGGGTQDAFVEKFNTNLSGAASRVYSTYLGGSGNDFGGGSGAFDPGKAIAIDAAGNAYVTGKTTSTNFPTANAFQPANGGNTDAFLTKLNTTGTALVYSTYLGGSGSNSDEGRGVAVNVVGNAYVTGLTNSANFPTTTPPPSLSATGGIFVTKFTPSGAAPLAYSTRLVSGAGDKGHGVALDGAGNAFVTGVTGSDVFLNEIADPTIIGRVVDEDNNPISSATVNLTGVPSATTTTDANGYFTFGLLTAGNSYTVSVVVPNYIFNSQTVNNLVKNVRLDFSPVVVSIGGQVTLGAGGLSAVAMTLSGGKSLNTQTDGGGNYSFVNLPAGRNYTVTPAKAGFGFEPTSRTFNSIMASQSANFIASATFQFNVGGYTASETAESATITIVRTSGASGPASVDYLTSDGSAQQTMDYTITIGTVNFAVNETSKSFDVPIINDLYAEGSETINITLSNPVGATLGTPNPAQVTITDNDAGTPTTNPLDNTDARFFVRQHYLDFLSRVPDQGGFDFWVGQITQCGTNQTCLNNKRLDVSNAFFYELEYQQTAAFVFRLYRAAFGNNQPFPNPDNSNASEAHKIPNYAAFSLDRARLIGSPNLAQDQLALANLFVTRPEFLTKYPGNLTLTQFVDAVLAAIQSDNGANLTSQRAALIALGSRGGVMYRLADDNLQSNPINNRLFINAEYNRSFVASQYFGYLRRDADIGGFLFWLGQVNSGPLRDLTKQRAMVCSFFTSAEYQLRFSSVVTHTNAECP